MRAQLLKWLSDLRSNYWFLPGLLAVAAVGAALVMLWVDQEILSEPLTPIPVLGANEPEGARAVLSTLAGSMITVAALTFSMTLLAVSHASTQFGPRLLSNFMRNRGNQFVLGVYAATFLYCLMVLRAVRSEGEVAVPPGESIGDGGFVPQASIGLAMVLAIADVGVLIYYIHHVAESIRLTSLVASVGGQLHSQIAYLFPEGIGEPLRDADQAETNGDPPADAAQRLAAAKEALSTAKEIRTRRAGFVQRIDDEGLIELACEHDLVIELFRKPGDFTPADAPLLRAGPGKRIDESLARDLAGMYASGIHRTPAQNALFLADQLAEVAARALSPGVNDPKTAVDCLNWLVSVLYQLRDREDPVAERVDSEGIVRVIAPTVTYHTFCDAVFGQLRPYFASDPNAALEMMKAIRWLAASQSDAKRFRLLCDFALSLRQLAEAKGITPLDLQRLDDSLPATGVPRNDEA